MLSIDPGRGEKRLISGIMSFRYIHIYPSYNSPTTYLINYSRYSNSSSMSEISDSCIFWINKLAVVRGARWATREVLEERWFGV